MGKKMFEVTYGILRESFVLFLDMSPYIVLGMLLAGILSVMISRETVSRHIGSHSFSSVLKASLLGVPLPLCSCGVIPAAVYLKKAGASNSAAMSFLISTPQTGIDSIIATYGLMGPFFAVFRPVAALFTGVWGGLLSLLFDRDGRSSSNGREGDIPADANACLSGCCEEGGHCHSGGAGDNKAGGLKAKLQKIYRFAFLEFMDDIALQFVIGIIIAGFISYMIPDNFFQDTAFSGGMAGMFLMILIGIPLYVCSTTSIPIALTLIAKGISPGAAYVFLIAGPATNAASLSILARVLGKKQTMIYLFSIITGSLASGFMIDMIAAIPGLVPEVVAGGGGNTEGNPVSSIIMYLASSFFLFLLVSAFFRKLRFRYVPGKGIAENRKCSDAGCTCGSH